MTFQCQNWRIHSHYYGGYVIQKKVGQQWKEASYFNSLAQAAKWLFDQRIHQESTDLVINTTNQAQAAIARAELIQLMEGIRDEIVEVLR